MIDYAKITVKGGKGGNGAGSFRRTKGKRRGKADGGDGGTGGNVWIEATLDLNTLEPFRFVKNYKAKDGQMGFSNLRRGANGHDLVLKVPTGTVIKIVDDRFQTLDEKNLSVNYHPEPRIYDLSAEGQKISVAKGGDGGRGNAKLRDEYGRRPKAGEIGKTGEVCQITLELKLIADVGLIGLPNAGKSTLLAVLTAARPQIASYPFTTLEPNLGVLMVPTRGPVSSFPPASARSSQKSVIDQKDQVELRAVGGPSTTATPRDSMSVKLVLADIPGLIEGAAQGKGLGDLFLKHIERTKILMHLIDVSVATDKWNDYQIIRLELKTYSKDLAKKKEIVVLNKIDSASPLEVSKIKQLFSQKRKKVFAVSALKKEGLEELVRMLVKMANKLAS